MKEGGGSLIETSSSVHNQCDRKPSVLIRKLQYTKELMCLCRKSTPNCDWKELELDKTTQEENIKDVLSNLDFDSVVAFTDGSALGNPGPTGSGAAIYYQGLEQEPVCLSMPVCSDGNNYIEELVGIQIALQHICEQTDLHKHSSLR